MSQSVRTIIFLGVAIACVGIGFATHTLNKPSDLDAFVDVGEPFYPDFTDPNAATGLRVASFNDETSKTEAFSVEVKDGLWRIPSHHDYPADGEDQLAKTAASMIGVERQALIERTKAAHKRYNLLDPLDKEVTGTEGRGDRITLYQGEEPVVDIIVGKQVEGQQNQYYVRAAGEDRFYTANLGDLKISTKFSDWIAKDILDINKSDARELIINRYQVDEVRRGIVQGDRLTLRRPTSTSDWALEGLNASKEELDTSNVTAMLDALDDLSIVGVRRKPKGISAGLKNESGDGVTTTDFDLLDLQEKGFFFDRRTGGILSNEGEVLLGTSQGVLYVLRFGEEFSGSEVDIEVGRQDKDQAKKDSKEKAKDESKKEDGKETESGEDETEKSEPELKSRYLFVTAQFDESLIGKKPTPPVKPEPPKKEETEKSAAKDEKPADDSPAAKEAESGDTETETAKEDLQKTYEKALEKYEEDLEIYEIKLKDYEEDMKKGQERVDELNRRFADWYYVIAADVFDRMKINRADLVKAIEQPAVEEGEKPTVLPGTPAAEKPEMKKPAEPAKDSGDTKPAEMKPEASPEKPAETKPAESKP
ncbi:DUF4340 domain-containing protein, partial [Thalassoglobus sp.]|uniref:DUF4340 domain-containing protein n=1 Tax=Thalassoglobus sp. TaxID=2795869 RepID=UPI003AA88B1F